MEKLQIFCDACGKEVKPSYFKGARLSLVINEWGGGSMGGNEDIFIQKADLCEDCAHKLQKFIKEELNIKPVNP